MPIPSIGASQYALTKPGALGTTVNLRPASASRAVSGSSMRTVATTACTGLSLPRRRQAGSTDARELLASRARDRTQETAESAWYPSAVAEHQLASRTAATWRFRRVWARREVGHVLRQDRWRLVHLSVEAAQAPLAIRCVGAPTLRDFDQPGRACGGRGGGGPATSNRSGCRT